MILSNFSMLRNSYSNFIPNSDRIISIFTNDNKQVEICAVTTNHYNMSHPSEPFNYFGYGSNMLTERIRISNPSATVIGIGQLLDFQFAFFGQSKTWKGASATIFPKSGSACWGVIWELGPQDSKSLDRQEAVGISYFRITVNVQLLDGRMLECRSYQKVNIPKSIDPTENRPSPHYKLVVVEGAKEHGIPAEYLSFLNAFQDNGYTGDINVGDMEVLKKLK